MQAQYCGCLKPMPFGEQVGNGKRMRQISCGEAGRFFRITCTAIIRQILSNLLHARHGNPVPMQDTHDLEDDLLI